MPSRCVERGVDVKSLSEMLGHTDVRTTLQVYVHSSLEHKMRVIQSICFLAPVLDPDCSPSPSPSDHPEAPPIPAAFDDSIANGIITKDNRFHSHKVHYKFIILFGMLSSIRLCADMGKSGVTVRATPLFYCYGRRNAVTHDFILPYLR